MTHAFDEATALEPIDGGFRAQTHPAYNNMVGPFGGITAANAADLNFASSIADQYGPKGVRVNTVNPGPVDTDANPADGPMRDLLHGFMAKQTRESDLKLFANMAEAPATARLERRQEQQPVRLQRCRA